MHTWPMNGYSRLSHWRRVREFAVPPSMIETAAARRAAGDWSGACAAARVDVDLNLRTIARVHGREFAARIRADLRDLAPDLLRWHMPRIAPDGLLRPGLTIPLTRYEPEHPGRGAPHLVVRTPPAWADAGQRISLALWDPSATSPGPHPHPHPHRRFRLDLHRHLWDARRAGELRIRSGADQIPVTGGVATRASTGGSTADLETLRGYGYAVDRWAAEARILLHAEGHGGDRVTVRLRARHRLELELATDGRTAGPPALRITTAAPANRARALPELPDAATWVPPDLALLRAGLIGADQLHPLVASALVADHPPAGPGQSLVDGVGPARAPDSTAGPPSSSTGRAGPRLVQCRGAAHRIGLVDGILAPLDHDPAEIRREELLAALTGTPLPCLQAIDEAHRHPECLDDVRARLDHGDIAGALAVVENLLGPDALLRDGALRAELETAALRRVTYGLFRAGMTGSGPGPAARPNRLPGGPRAHPRHATTR